MGDRANIVVHDTGPSPVYLYSHWDGLHLLDVLAVALDSPQGRGRWSDPSYLARIIFCHMIFDDVDGETGYGIGSREPDNEHPFINVFPSAQEVEFNNDTYEFDEFISWRKSLVSQ